MIACVTIVAAAILVSASGVARANQLVTITLADRHGEIGAKYLTDPGPPRADVLLPDGFKASKRYPLIVLLPGFSNTYAILLGHARRSEGACRTAGNRGLARG